jgi:hypothetical protein
MDQDRLPHPRRKCPVVSSARDGSDDNKQLPNSSVDNEQLACTRPNGTRPDRPGGPRGPTPRVKRVYHAYAIFLRSLTNLSLSLPPTALVPPSVLPRPSPPLQPSLSRSDQPLERARQHLAPRSADTRPRARPPLRTRRHIRTRQILGGRCTGIHRRARGAPPPMQTSREDRPS